MLRDCLGKPFFYCQHERVADESGRHSAEELEAMDEDEDVPPPVPKLNQTTVNGA